MANLLLQLLRLLMVSITLLEARAVFPVILGVKHDDNYESNLRDTTTEVFDDGKFSPKLLNYTELDPLSPPRDLTIIAPSEEGKYPVILFNHGTLLLRSFYYDLLRHISSHGYIIVAPQYYDISLIDGTNGILLIDGMDELDWAIRVANWIPSGLETILPGTWDQKNIALAGHSRGGLIAFAMALGKHKDTTLQVKISALIGIDPVAGRDSDTPIEPFILTYEPESLDISIPVTVIGSGKGGSCTPKRMNHIEFFSESRAPSSHFVATTYGHIDMLNDKLTGLEGFIARFTCGGNHGPRKYMRRTVGGIVVSFLRAYFHGQFEDYTSIINEPSLAPATLDEPVQVHGELAIVARI